MTPHRRPSGVALHRQRAAVALRPHQPLGVGRDQLAVLGVERSLGIEEQERVVEAGPAGLGVALVDADDELDAGIAGRLPEPRGLARGRRDRVGHQLGVEAGLGAAIVGRQQPHPVGIGGNERFREHHQLGPGAAGFGNQAAGLLDRGIAVEEHRGVLDHRDPEGRDRAHASPLVPPDRGRASRNDGSRFQSGVGGWCPARGA